MWANVIKARTRKRKNSGLTKYDMARAKEVQIVSDREIRQRAALTLTREGGDGRE
jgi:hypothetical protein